MARLRSSRRTDHCQRCGRDVIAVRPHWAWRVASVGTLAFFVLLAFAVGVSGFLLFGAGFVVFALGALVLGPLADRAFDPPRCPDCRCVIVPAAAAPSHEAVAAPPRRRAA
jgi:hypothetical protein